MCTESHFDSPAAFSMSLKQLWCHQRSTSLDHHCSPFSFSVSNFSMSMVMLCRCVTIGKDVFFFYSATMAQFYILSCFFLQNSVVSADLFKMSNNNVTLTQTNTNLMLSVMNYTTSATSKSLLIDFQIVQKWNKTNGCLQGGKIHRKHVRNTLFVVSVYLYKPFLQNWGSFIKYSCFHSTYLMLYFKMHIKYVNGKQLESQLIIFFTSWQQRWEESFLFQSFLFQSFLFQSDNASLGEWYPPWILPSHLYT